MKKILYIQPIHPDGMDLLREKYNVVVAPDTNRETLMREIRDASAIVTRLSTVDADLMAAGERLCVVGRHGVGLDNIDVAYAKAHGIAVVTTGNANSSTVAEHALFALGALMKRIPMLDREMHRGNWACHDLPGACDAAGRTLAVLGFGRIGQCVARMAACGLDMHVGNRSIIPRYRKVVVPSAHTAENHDFISSDQGSRSSTSKSLFRSARSGSMLSR